MRMAAACYSVHARQFLDGEDGTDMWYKLPAQEDAMYVDDPSLSLGSIGPQAISQSFLVIEHR